MLKDRMKQQSSASITIGAFELERCFRPFRCPFSAASVIIQKVPFSIVLQFHTASGNILSDRVFPSPLAMKVSIQSKQTYRIHTNLARSPPGRCRT